MKKYPGFMESFKQLVATPSVSSVDPAFDQSNKPVIDLMANWLEDLGAKVELMPVPDRDGKYNLIACVGEGDGGLVLSGHTDTVPFNEHLWQQDPFKLTEKENKLYGLGSTDMKVFFPFVLEQLNKLDIKKLKQPLFLLATADEESTMSGAMAVAASGKKLGRYALIGEPTGLKPVNRHKGILVEAIHVFGKAGHSSNPALGLNAIDGMNKVISALVDLRQAFINNYHDDDFAVPYPTMNFGSVHGGDNPNRICPACELKLDVRLLPDSDMEEMRWLVQRTAEDALANTDWDFDFETLFAGMPAMQTDRHAEIVKLAEEFSGHESESVGFGTEGPYLNDMGMQTVIFGPGDIDVAHQANEYIPLDRIDPMTKILDSIVNRICIE